MRGDKTIDLTEAYAEAFTGPGPYTDNLGRVLALAEDGRVFDMVIESVYFAEGQLIIVATHKALEEDVPLRGYQLYGEDGEMVVARPLEAKFQAADPLGDQQNLIIKWVITGTEEQ